MRLGERAAALALVGVLALAGPAAAGGRAPVAGAPEAAGRAAVSVNGYDLPTDAAPVLRRGRTLVPVRAVAEALGAEVAWNAETRTVTLSRNGRSVSLTIDAPIARMKYVIAYLNRGGAVANESLRDRIRNRHTCAPPAHLTRPSLPDSHREKTGEQNQQQQAAPHSYSPP